MSARRALALSNSPLVSFSLFLDAFPPLDPRCPLDNCMSLYKYTTCVKDVLGLGGERGCISERRHQSSDNNILEDFENASPYFCTFLANRICDGQVTRRF